LGAQFTLSCLYGLTKSSVNLSTGIWKNDAGSLTVSRILIEVVSNIMEWSARNLLLLMRLIEVMCDMTLELGEDQRGPLRALYTGST